MVLDLPERQRGGSTLRGKWQREFSIYLNIYICFPKSYLMQILNNIHEGKERGGLLGPAGVGAGKGRVNSVNHVSAQVS